MASNNALGAASDGVWNAFAALVDGDGTAAHPHARRLSLATADPAALTDAIHHLCLLHGRHPGLVDRAAAHPVGDLDGVWLAAATRSFADERATLVPLVAATGPLPSTPGQAETEAAIMAQRHAIDMLGQSARPGCATGAALALVIDWRAIRRVIDNAGTRLGQQMTPAVFPDPRETAALVAMLVSDGATERAMLFGAQQLLAQHRGLWDLLEVRAEARG